MERNMLVELTIENFRSIAEPATVTFAAGATSQLSGNLLRLRNGERIIKSMALYGPNASGKTTLLEGLYAIRSFVQFSSQDQKPTAKIPQFEPFALDSALSKRPSRISLTIGLDGDRFTFEVAATTHRVWSESLKVQHMSKQPSRKTQARTLLKRTWQPSKKVYATELHEAFGTELTRSGAIEQTTPNRLMVGKLASMNSDLARRIFEWFDDDLDFYDMHRNPNSEDLALAECARLLGEDKTFAAIVARFMKDADTGIRELRIVDEKTFEPVFSESDMEFKETIQPGLSFRHNTEDGSEVFLLRQRESSGTLRFVAMLAAIFKPGPRRRLICIDELSASMHPELVRRLIRLVHSSRYNGRGNQLIFTTHDTHLLDPKELLRRDQVTICSKDRFGRSSTKRLDEFQDAARSDANLQKQYLQGRFGGLPQFGPSLEDVPVDEEAMEVGA